MPRLILMRHSKTEANNPQGDKARHLLPTGVQDAQEAGVALRELGVDYALVSTAVRTRETFAATGLQVPAEFQDALYFGGVEEMLQRIGEMDDDEVSCLLVIGHNPTIASLAARLAYDENRREADQLQCWYPTSAFSSFEVDGTWAEFGQVRLEQVRRPG